MNSQSNLMLAICYRRVQTLVTCVPRVVISLVFAFSLTAEAIPEDPSDYTIINGGLADVAPNAYVEGSARTGGIQPDYFIDVDSEPLKGLLEKAEAIRKIDVPYWDRVGMVIELVKFGFFKYRNYSNPYYRRLLKKYRIQNQDVPLSEYFVCAAGVCREYALALHFALKAAGIENKHGYAKIFRASLSEHWEVTEDHAFNVVRYKGVDWVLDAYYWGFNGFKLKDLMSPEGITKESESLPFAKPGPGVRKILAINSFPRIFNPKHTLSCQQLFRF